MTGAEPGGYVEVGEPGGLRAQINVRGGELWRLIDRDGTDLQWSGDPEIWSGRAPILFPIVGSLVGGVYRYGDGSFPLGRHGFARHTRFTVVEHSADSALLRLEASLQSRRVYPFEFRLDLRFTCRTGALEVAASVENTGPEALPFSFGFHPALRWPLEPSAPRSDHYIRFAEPEPGPVSRLDSDGLILPERQPSPIEGQTLHLRDELFVADALIFSDLASRSVEYGAADAAGNPRGRQLRVAFENLPLLGVWTKPGAGYICIEPWQGIADPEGFTGDIFAKPGIIALAPEASWHARMVLTPVAAR